MSNRSDDEALVDNDSNSNSIERNERQLSRNPLTNNSSSNHQDALRRLTCNRSAASFASSVVAPMNNNNERRSRSASGAADEEVSDGSQVRMIAFPDACCRPRSIVNFV